MRRHGEPEKHDKRRPRPGPSVYESRFLDRAEPEDRTEWVKLAEVDVPSGRTTWYRRYKPFGQTPLSEWKPFGRP
jgi:hypothetical protein